MCSAASQMAKGNYNVRTQFNDKSELSELSYSLNYLASTLESSVMKLKNEKDKLNSIIENISDGLAAFDTNLRLIKYNAALLKLCTQEHFQNPKVKDAIMQVMQTGERSIVVLEDKDILRFTISRIKNEGIVEGVVVIVQDISQSERLEKLRREFVANVSHEFRTPLTIIKGSVEALIDGAIQSEEDRSSYYNRIENETIALERLVKDLLDTSRFKAGKITLEIKKVDVTKILTDLRENLSTIAAEKNIQIIYEKKPLPDVMGDHDRLRQLFIIFIDNAIKFTPNNGTITLSTDMKDNMAYINIRDTGVGISEEDIPFIFERFYKVDKSRGGSETGTGLGLSIAWQIAELHGGTILVESERGKGTLFKILIPIYKEDKSDDKSNNKVI
jgi:two-component system sensor histidine kinase ResE